ncbi:MAG TPA: DUF2797 domain-containing protein [Mariniphaga sp.]|nr:DUF2797 domain-containing protein [Mariniphaga sp.]
MMFEGNILKMRTEAANPISYSLPIGENLLPLNPLIGKEIKLQFNGQINCIACGKKTKRSFGQGYCYKCLQIVPEVSESVIRPELSRSHFGISRDQEWAEIHDLTDHYVYLAVACDLKVGVTRHHQIPYRWIDQGASYAIRLSHTPNRHIAGVIEVFLKRHIADRTNWQGMLKSCGNESINLIEEKRKAHDLLPAELKKYTCPDDTVTELIYPMIEYPLLVKSLTFDKTPFIEGVLNGIKGQYLVFNNGTVLNIRKHSGYFIQVDYTN